MKQCRYALIGIRPKATITAADLPPPRPVWQ
jgi:hypothetical protein